jgi:hypothetical protein
MSGRMDLVSCQAGVTAYVAQKTRLCQRPSRRRCRGREEDDDTLRPAGVHGCGRAARRYGVIATRPWLDHLQKSSVRFDIGGSGAFVSPDGLLITNQHVELDCLQKISTAANDFAAAGYYAKPTRTR